MKVFTVIVLFLVTLFTCEGQDEYLNSPLYPCVKCLCHARSGCWIRQNCAKYSIDKNYWIEGGSLVVDIDDNPNDDESYQKCMLNENCIVGTIIKYTDKHLVDCNCDGNIDCKDRAAVHLFKNKCQSPKFGRRYAKLFNQCAASANVSVMLAAEGGDLCSSVDANVEVF